MVAMEKEKCLTHSLRRGRRRPRRARVCHGVPVGGACSVATQAAASF
jgi:hypothetical protein